jgi:hypothetical protein
VKESKEGNFENLDLTHHLSSGFKAFFTDMTHNALEQIRQTCGGSGFSANSGFAEII